MQAVKHRSQPEAASRMIEAQPVRRGRPRRVLAALALYGVALGGSLALLFPLFWMISTSLKSSAEANAPRIVWWPAQPQLAAYAQIFNDPQWLRYLANSVFVTALGVLGTLISVAAVAYAVSRIEWPGRSVVFMLLLSTLMLPPQTTLVPQYVLFNRLGWINTFNPIIIPGFFAGGATFIFLLRQFMLTLPRELDEAAMIDGANHLTIWWRIILPLCKPALASITIFLFVAQWNAFQVPLIYLQRTSLYTLPIAINNLYNPQQVSQPWPLIMAASVLTTLPLLLGFVFAQRYVFESVALTGLKG
ncbi:MAG TPA: carbohydrate ABC transporter permease [Herpetosiphonaceae bacterium]